jgi:hypothetical protein
MARLQITRDRQRDKEQNKRGAQRAHTSQRCITLPAATMRAQSRLFAPPAARGLWVISPAHQGGQGRTDSRVGMYAPEAFSAESGSGCGCCCCAETFSLIHENESLRPRPATNARGKHRQFMQKCVCRDEFIFEGTFSQAAAVSRRRSQDPRPDRARGGAGPGRVVMGWSGAPIPPLKAAQGQRVVEKGSDVASPHCGPGLPAS